MMAKPVKRKLRGKMNSWLMMENLELLLDAVHLEFKDQKKLSEQTLSKLSFLFGHTAVQAMDLVDHRCISHVVSPSGREIYKIQSSPTEYELCYKNTNLCTCNHFESEVLKGDNLMCKHKLASLISSAMGICEELKYSDKTLTLMLHGFKDEESLRLFKDEPEQIPVETSSGNVVQQCTS